MVEDLDDGDTGWSACRGLEISYAEAERDEEDESSDGADIH